MGLLLDENGDPKAWASCLLCGLAAMGGDESEAEKDKKARLERKARWKAEKTAAVQTASQLPPAASTTAEAATEEETELHTADLIRPIVINQPQRVRIMSATPADLPMVIITSPTIVENEPLSDSRPTPPYQQPHSRSATPASTVRSRAQSMATTESTHSKYDSPARATASPSKAFRDSVICPLCEATNHREEHCPRLAGIAISPTPGRAPMSGRSYAASHRWTTSVAEKRGIWSL